MLSKLFSIVLIHCSDALRQRNKTCDDGLADLVESFAGNMREGCKPAFALHERDICLFVARTDRGIAYPLIHRTARCNRGRSFGNGASTNDLVATTLSAGLELAPFLMAMKVFPKRSALCHNSVSVLVDRFMAPWQRNCNLLESPLQDQPFSASCRITGSIGRAIRLAWARC